MRRLTLLLLLLTAATAAAQSGNRLAYLDDLDPYYPDRHFPKLITPQWVSEEGVDAVVVLAIDDMRATKPYEVFLRPILRRLQQIDGRAPVSIMSCSPDPQDAQLQTWLKEGLSIECHTIDHPCPFFKPGFAKARETYERCVDLMHEIPGNRPVAFRMPCCDSLNTPSPRFWAEVFNKTTAKDRYLTIDSSVFNVFTSADPDLPRELVLDDQGQERFKPYLPAERSFVNTIENYPYPYVIGKLCWEFPCVTPSDWQAQHRHKPNNPLTVRDMKAALDCTVVKRGVFCLVFHPHGWIKSEQVVELIDHAVQKHGKKVKFLTFREAQERLDKSLFDGKSPRVLKKTEADRRVLRVGRDEITIENNQGEPRVSVNGKKAPFGLPPGARLTDDAGLRFLDLDGDGKLDVLFSNEKEYGVYLFTDLQKGWSRKVVAGKQGEPNALPPIAKNGTNNGFFVHSGYLWWSNEDTALLKDHVDRRSIKALLDGK